MAKSNVSASLDRAFQDMASQIVREAIGKLPRSMTMGDLYNEFSGSAYASIFHEMPLSTFATAIGGGQGGGGAAGAGAKTGTRGPGRPKGSKNAGTTRRASGGKSWNTRTEEGRQQLDAAITQAFESQETLNAEQLREAVGGKPPQLRESLKRLMDQGLVRKTGEKRATRYHWKKR